MSLLRDSFEGINARFHLVGVYTLAALLFRMAGTYTGDDPGWIFLIVLAIMLFYVCVCGVMGHTYQAAAGRPAPMPFVGYALRLFVPLLWLSIKIFVPVFGLTVCGAFLYHAAAGIGTPFEKWLPGVFFWADPLVGLVVQVLALYSTPLCIQGLDRRVRRPSIREGLRYFAAAPAASRRLVSLLILIAALGGGLQFARGSEAKDAPPDFPEAMILFATSYLSLVTFFGATRVVLSLPDPRARRDLAAAAAAPVTPPGPALPSGEDGPPA